MCTLPKLQRYDFLEILELEKKQKRAKAETIEFIIAENNPVLAANTINIKAYGLIYYLR
jgi:hypothetical protein